MTTTRKRLPESAKSIQGFHVHSFTSADGTTTDTFTRVDYETKRRGVVCTIIGTSWYQTETWTVTSNHGATTFDDHRSAWLHAIVILYGQDLAHPV